MALSERWFALNQKHKNNRKPEFVTYEGSQTVHADR